MKTTITIVNRETLTRKINSLNKKLAKRGHAPIVILGMTPRRVPVTSLVNEFDDFAPIHFDIPCYDVELELPIERIDTPNVELMGFIEVLGNNVLLNAVKPEMAATLEQFRHVGVRCDHCRTTRARKKVFIFQHEGDYKLIGHACAQEYFGMDIASTLSQIVDVAQNGFDEEGGSYRAAAFAQMRFLALCLFFIQREGFKPSKFEAGSTSFRASNLLHKQKPDAAELDLLREFHAIHEKMFEDAAKIAPFFDTLENPDTFTLNCIAVLAYPAKPKLGMLAACANTYFKATDPYTVALNAERDAAKKAEVERRRSESEHIGKEGERVTTEAVVGQLRYIEGEFGTTTIVKLRMDNGGTITWFASNPPELALEQRVSITGRVKKLDEYLGIKNTVLTRCKIEVVK